MADLYVIADTETIESFPNGGGIFKNKIIDNTHRTLEECNKICVGSQFPFPVDMLWHFNITKHWGKS